jgi:mitochondrial import receptor subunit TOM40
MANKQQNMLQNELDYVGSDYSINLKAINPDPQDATGIYTLSYLQSITKSLAFGGEFIAQKGAGEPADTGLNLIARWSAKPAQPISNQTEKTSEKLTEQKTPPAMFTLTLQQFVACQASYFHRVSDKIELAAEWQSLLIGPRRDAITTVSAKFDYRQACIRTQLDSQGRVQLLFEERLFPGFSLLLSGELDHVRGSSRFGVGLNLEN